MKQKSRIQAFDRKLTQPIQGTYNSICDLFNFLRCTHLTQFYTWYIA